MSLNSKIEWTHSTWNPVTGCSKISLGCENCYAERMAKRLKAMENNTYKNGFKVTLHEELLEKPLKWRQPQMVFVNSMGDLFHEDVPVSFIFDTFKIMKQAEWHTFQVLTKRTKRLKELSKEIEWPKNVWIGVTIESEEYVSRLNDILDTDAYIQFISFEPLLSQIKNICFKGINWVIVGGESGPKSRTMKKEWVFDIYEQCKTDNIPFFFKQWGGFHKKKNGRLFQNKVWNEMPLI